LEGGSLDLNFRELSLYGGKASGRVVLNGSHQVPSVQSAFRGEGVEATDLIRDLAGFDPVAGTSSFAVSLAGTGRTQPEMISTLKGSAELRLMNGMLKDISLAQMVRHVKETIVSGWEAERGQRTAVLDLSATFALEDGIASNGDLKLQTRDLTVTGDGRV